MSAVTAPHAPPLAPEALAAEARALVLGRLRAELSPDSLVDPDSGAPRQDATVTSLEPLTQPDRVSRTRIKVRLWRFKAEVSIEQNAATGDPLAWRNYTAAAETGDRIIDRKTALRIAQAEIGPLPKGAADPDISFRETGQESTYEVQWSHFTDPETLVEGDKLVVRINAATARVHSVFRKWRQVPGE
jgi:hypothetical protein